MASVDTESERAAATLLGWRTFRVTAQGEAIDALEILCPASEEAGKRTQCERCKLCSGLSRPAKSIAIPSHGAGKGHFERVSEAARALELLVAARAVETRQAA